MSNHREEQKQFCLLENYNGEPNIILAANTIYFRIGNDFSDHKVEAKYMLSGIDGNIYSVDIFSLSEVKERAKKMNERKFKVKYFALKTTFAIEEAYYNDVNSEYFKSSL